MPRTGTGLGQEVGQIEHQGECRAAVNVSSPGFSVAGLPRIGSTAMSLAEMSDLQSPPRWRPEVGGELS